jgi:hypothetical protein
LQQGGDLAIPQAAMLASQRYQVLGQAFLVF